MKRLKNIELLQQNEAYIKVLQWFFAYPLLPITLTELAKETGISKKTATNIVSKLLDEGFLIKEEIGRAWRIYANQQNIHNSIRKIGYNLTLVYQMLYESRIIEEIYKIVESPKAIVLFGSYRKGDDTDKSDIDLAIEVSGNEEVKLLNLGVLPQFGYRKNVPINLYIFSRNKIDINLFSNIVNGIVIEGFLEARP